MNDEELKAQAEVNAEGEANAEAEAQEAELAPDEKWSKAINESNGTMMFPPESMGEKSDEFTKKFDAHLKAAKEFDQLSAEFTHFKENFWFEMRKSLQENGVPDAFSKTMGPNIHAREDGLFVINITNQGPQQI